MFVFVGKEISLIFFEFIKKEIIWIFVTYKYHFKDIFFLCLCGVWKYAKWSERVIEINTCIISYTSVSLWNWVSKQKIVLLLFMVISIARSEAIKAISTKEVLVWMDSCITKRGFKANFQHRMGIVCVCECE